jgi:transposase
VWSFIGDEAEGISTQAYAQREGLSVSALYYWRGRLKGKAKQAKGGADFVAVRLERPLSEPKRYMLLLGPWVRLELSEMPGPTWLAALAAALPGRVG